ncbi:1049_t:CDS:2, partial [Funneliformis caledonium]
RKKRVIKTLRFISGTTYSPIYPGDDNTLFRLVEGEHVYYTVDNGIGSNTPTIQLKINTFEI